VIRLIRWAVRLVQEAMCEDKRPLSLPSRQGPR
jgi:hypothetical protein